MAAKSARTETLSPELRLLIACAHTRLTESQKERARIILAHGVDEHELYELAALHGLLMLLYHGLLQIRPTPESLANLINRLAADSATYTMLYEFVHPPHLARVLAAFQERNVEAIVLKGAALGLLVYGQPALRPYSDFDLLLHQSDLSQAEAALSALGYAPDESEHPRAWYREHHHHLAPYDQDDTLPVEIHWALTNADERLAINYADIWAQSQTVDIGGLQTRALCPEHQLIHLCVHVVHVHAIAEIGLRPVWDVYEVLANCAARFDWARLVSACLSWRCARQVVLMLRLVEAFFDYPVPSGVFDQLGSASLDEPLLDYAFASIIEGTMPGLRQSSGLAQVWYKQSMRERIEFILAHFFPPRVTLSQQYGLAPDAPLLPLYYPRWQAVLLKRHVGSAWRMIRGDSTTLVEAEQESTRQRLVQWLAAEA
jgi:hypothetical protein